MILSLIIFRKISNYDDDTQSFEDYIIDENTVIETILPENDELINTESNSEQSKHSQTFRKRTSKDNVKHSKHDQMFENLLYKASEALNSTDPVKKPSTITLFMDSMAVKIFEADLNASQIDDIQEHILSCVNKKLTQFRNES